jgi:hypothetical protein
MPPNFGNSFKQRVDKARVYFTRYATFVEPDPSLPAALFIDAATGAPTQELTLNAPIYDRVFTRSSPNPTELTAPTTASTTLPYDVKPPGFPPLPPPPQIVGLIASLTGAPQAVVEANTTIFLCAIGQLLAEGSTTGRLTGNNFEVTKDMRFQVRIRTGFIFQSPGNPAGNIGVLTGFLTHALLHQLIQLPPPPNPDEVVLYDWKAPMTLSTSGSYVRPIANEPTPVANPFRPGVTEIRFEGDQIDNAGKYKIAGFAPASSVVFTAPPQLVQFLFQTNQLTDVEFAYMEEGVLEPL